MTSFTQLLSSFTQSVDGSTTVMAGIIDSSWGQGRTCFGGVGAAIALSAAQLVVQQQANTAEPASPTTGGGALPSLRSVTATFVGPIAPGTPIEVRAALLRQGRSVVVVETKIYQAGDVCTSLNAIFGAARVTTAGVSASAVLRDAGAVIPDREALKPIPALKDRAGNLMEPLFLQQFEVRHEMGLPLPVPKPFQGRRFSGWIRLKDDDAHAQHPTARLLAICDMPPPLMMLHYKVPITGSTLTWSLEFVQNPERVATTWFYLDYHLDAAADGYSQQSGTIYDESGAVVALSRQCMVYFEPKAAPAAAPVPAAVDAASTTASA